MSNFKVNDLVLFANKKGVFRIVGYQKHSGNPYVLRQDKDSNLENIFYAFERDLLLIRRTVN